MLEVPWPPRISSLQRSSICLSQAWVMHFPPSLFLVFSSSSPAVPPSLPLSLSFSLCVSLSVSLSFPASPPLSLPSSPTPSSSGAVAGSSRNSRQLGLPEVPN